MKNPLKILALVIGTILLVCSSVATTLAWLTDNATIVNTFTVGNVAITMDETDVDNSTADADRDTANVYQLVPGKSFTKDPIIHIAANSDNAYLFVQITNELTSVEGADTIESQLVTKGWKGVLGHPGVYYYSEGDALKAVSANTNVPVFDTFTVANDATNNQLANVNSKAITVTAYAIQAEGMTGKTPAQVWSLAH